MLPALFCFGYFLDKALCFTLGLTSDPPTYASPVAGITGVYHMPGLLVEIGGLGSHFFPQAGWPQTEILLLSTS
jgi:hypothetical protein